MTWRKLSLHWTASAFSCKQYSAQNRRETAVEAPNALVFMDNRLVICDLRSFQDDYSQYSVNSMCFAVRKPFSIKIQHEKQVRQLCRWRAGQPTARKVGGTCRRQVLAQRGRRKR